MNTNPKAKRILCFGDSNTWGWVPLKLGKQRLNVNERWTGILQDLLGSEFEVIEEALPARTIAIDDPRENYPGRNGYESLKFLLESHLPLDLFVAMIGTPNLKSIFDQSPEEIANELRKVIDLVQNFKTLDHTAPPKILIVVPAVIDENTDFAREAFARGTEKSKQIPSLYRQVAGEMGTYFIDPTNEISADPTEGVHITKESNKILAQLIFEKVKEIL